MACTQGFARARRLPLSMNHRYHHARSTCSRSFAAYATGRDEEYHIAQAIRNVKKRMCQHDATANVVLEVMNGFHASLASELFPAKQILNGGYDHGKRVHIPIKVLTRADVLGPEALKYQMQAAAKATKKMGHSSTLACMPVVALNLDNAEGISKKQVKPLLNIIAGANELASRLQQEQMMQNGANKPPPNIFVCGLPNAGKSSLIMTLSRARTLEVRKKKGYHLPKVSYTAGKTLAVKGHAVEHPTKKKVLLTLNDTPGIRPRLDLHYDAEHDKRAEKHQAIVAHLMASGSLEARKGVMNDEALRERIVQILWKGLQRYSAVVASTEFPYSSPAALLDGHKRSVKTDSESAVIIDLIRQCRKGAYGGLIMEDPDLVPLSPPEQDNAQPAEMQINDPRSSSRIVAMNDTAKLLHDIGTGMRIVDENLLEHFRPPQPPNRHQTRRDLTSVPASPQGAGSSREQFRRSVQRDAMRQSPRPRKESLKPQDPPREREIRRVQKSQFQEWADVRNRRLVKQGFAVEVTSPPPRPPGSQPVRYAKTDSMGRDRILCLPIKQQSIECMKCAGFIKRTRAYIKDQKSTKKYPVHEFSGRSYERVLNLSVDTKGYRDFFSRVWEAFGGGSHMGHLIGESLVRTVQRKHKMTSMRKVLTKYEELKKRGWFVPNKDRHPRFQNHQPLPFSIVCNARTCRRQDACWRLKEQGDTELILAEPRPKPERLNKRSRSTSTKQNKSKG